MNQTKLNQTNQTKVNKRLPLKVYTSKALVAAIVATVLNIIVFYIGKAAGAFPDTIKIMADNPLQVSNVIIISLISAVAGILVFAAVGSLRVFQIIAVIVFILFFFSPFSVVNSSTSFIVFLEIMHVISAGVIVWIASRKDGLR